MKVVKKPWGKEVWFAHTPRYVGKFLFIRKGHRLSLQYHRVKQETVYTDQGRYLLELNGRRRIMAPGSVASIRPGDIHRFSAAFNDTRLIEVSTPEVDDVVRLSDDYGRIPAKGKPPRGR
ncbi:MAG: cupin domain-containing protein [Elusimicrobia bacterium]|nr:cupin domain-containing protein [Elusimicrobiota bacterium]